MGSKGKKLKRRVMGNAQRETSYGGTQATTYPITEAERLAVHDEEVAEVPAPLTVHEAIEGELENGHGSSTGMTYKEMLAVDDALPDHAPNAIGWNGNLSKFVNTTMAAKAMAEAVLALVKDIDRESAHLAAGIVALSTGEFDLAHMNLYACGWTTVGPSVVEEVEVD